MKINRKISIVSIVGARPQFIKTAAICRAVKGYNASNNLSINHLIIHTGQHYDRNMSEVFFDELDIPHPDFNLGIGSATHGKQTGKMLEAIEDVLLKIKPDWVLVYGDTNSTLAGALAAAKLHIPLAHIEGGLRSFNRRMPEEINRVLTDHVSTLIFCPTDTSIKNLEAEGIKDGVELVGDVMYDCAQYYAGKVKDREDEILSKYNLNRSSYYLATVHRPENTDDISCLRNIIRAFNEISSPGFMVVFPIHPRTRKMLAETGIEVSAYVKMILPVSYLEMVALERNARIILTDSGGVQKEAYFYGVPCVTLREETEWVETVEAEMNVLTGSDTEAIIKAVSDQKEKSDFQIKQGLYGNGNSGSLIINKLLDFSEKNNKK